jgi:hypothetical protein
MTDEPPSDRLAASGPPTLTLGYANRFRGCVRNATKNLKGGVGFSEREGRKDQAVQCFRAGGRAKEFKP